MFSLDYQLESVWLQAFKALFWDEVLEKKKEKKNYIYGEKVFFRVHKIQRQNDGYECALN